MNLAKDMLNQIADPTLTPTERVQRRCQFAKQLEKLGNYERARESMGELWQGIGKRPVLDEFDQRTTAEVLLRVGALTGEIGSIKQIEGAQEKAKSLIYESIRIFESLQDEEKAAEAQTDLACCYLREGAFDEARIMIQGALERLGNRDSEVQPVALLHSALIERLSGRFNDALRIHTEAAPILKKSKDDAIKGKFHMEFANVLNHLSSTEYREDYVDRALIEYTAASFHLEQAGNTRNQACVENNLGFLFGTIGKFPEAHEHLDRAQALLTTLKDSLHLAQVDETRAKVLLEQRKEAEAEKLVRSAVRVLERGGEQSLLAEALTTHGIALARLGRPLNAYEVLRRAVEVAQQAGDVESAGQAALTIIEECGSHLSESELSEIYERAADLLDKSQNMATVKRLCACARRVLFLTGASPSPHDWKGFSFRDAVRRYESHLIERALRDADGMVSKAAQWLGFKHHHSLISLLKNRHQHLLHVRTPIVPRRRSIIRTPASYESINSSPESTARAVVILHAEDNEQLAGAVRESLEEEGWTVRHSTDGADALRQIAGDVRYDLLLLDNELPGASGVELVRHARSLPHRQQTPIVILSAGDCEADALRAGADAFLRKPEDIALLAETLARLLEGRRA